MTKVNRLFALMQILRGRQRAVTAQFLAERLQVSERTIYRDVQALIALGAAIDGSAGVGYLLRSGFFLPALMFNDEEMESLVLGGRWVAAQDDAGLATAAESALAKIATAADQDLRDKMAEIGLWAPRAQPRTRASPLLPALREAIRFERKLSLDYVDADGRSTERLIWPIGLGFFDGTRVVAAWCELRAGFRHFRVDRIAAMRPLDARYPKTRRELVRRWREQQGQRPRAPATDAEPARAAATAAPPPARQRRSAPRS